MLLRGWEGAQVATEWLFSVPEHVLERHLAPDPNTPTGEADGGDARAAAPPRPLAGAAALRMGTGHSMKHAARSWKMKQNPVCLQLC